MFEHYPAARLTLYGLSILAAVAAPFVAIGFPDYGPAVVAASSILAAAAGVTAASNVNTHEEQ
jgi:hypothetical protein